MGIFTGKTAIITGGGKAKSIGMDLLQCDKNSRNRY